MLALPRCVRCALSCLLLALASFHGSLALAAEKLLTFVGTYTKGTQSKGIYAYEFDVDQGTLSPLEVTEGVENPSFLAIHPSGKFLYSVDEVNQFEGESSGAVSAFAIHAATGKLTHLNTRRSQGADPCHLVVDKGGRNVLAASYTGGSVIVFPIGADGRLGEASSFIQHTGSSVNAERQAAPHAHWIDVDPTNRFAFVADLGLDQIVQYRFDAAAGKLTPNEPPAARVKPGAGPRHVAFHPDGTQAFVINELDLTVTVLPYDTERGSFGVGASLSVLPPDVQPSPNFSTAEIAAHPSGKYLYGSIRGLDQIVVFSIDSASGALELVEHESTQGSTPRHFAIDPSGKWLLAENQNSNSIVVFRIDPETGALEPTGQRVEVPAPVCLVMLRR